MDRLYVALVVSLLISPGLALGARAGPVPDDAPSVGALAGDHRFVLNDRRFGADEFVMIEIGVLLYLPSCFGIGGGKPDFLHPVANAYVIAGLPGEGALADASGGEPNRLIGFSGGAIAFETIGITGPTGRLGTGVYSIVIDECQNGKYDPEVDTLLANAFSVTVPVGVPPSPALQALKSASAQRAKLWEDKAEADEDLFKLLDLLEKLGEATSPSKFVIGLVKDEILDTMKGAIGETLGIPLEVSVKDYVKTGAVDIEKALGEHYKGIAADPPDPAFLDVASLAVPRVPEGATDDAVFDAQLALVREAALEAALAEALLRGVERYQGADAASSGAGALLQARAASATAALLAAQAERTSGSALALRAALLADAADVEAAVENGTLAREALIAAELPEEALASAGNAELDRVALASEVRASALATPPPASLAAHLELLDGLVANEGTLTAALADLGAQFDAIAAVLAADPQVPTGVPRARAHAEPVAEGATAVLDGTGSTSVSPILAYEWDTDGDGAFDDATGAAASIVAGHAGLRPIALRVTTRAGFSDVAYTMLRVLPADAPAQIAAATPAARVVVGEVGQTLEFSITASDPEGAPVASTWKRDVATPIASGPSFAWTLAAEDAGMHELHVSVDDGSPVGGGASRSWIVDVVFPDADGDMWRANVDCDDADAAIHPGAPDVLNGLDDDCDATTQDGGVAPVVQAGPDLVVMEGARITLGDAGFVGFTHPDLGAPGFSASVDWGDGTSETAALEGAAVRASHVYVDDGARAIRVCVRAPTGAIGCDDARASVTNAPPEIAPSVDLRQWRATPPDGWLPAADGTSVDSSAGSAPSFLASEHPVSSRVDVRVTLPAAGLTRGRMIVDSDEWTMTQTRDPSRERYIRNVARYFAGDGPGRFLAWSDNVGAQTFPFTMRADGHTVDRLYPPPPGFSLQELLQYDAVFVGGAPVNNSLLVDYVRAGGNLYVFLGTGTTGHFYNPDIEANAWSEIMAVAGVAARRDRWNDVVVHAPPGDPTHPLMAGVQELYTGVGSSLSRLETATPATRLVHWVEGPHGLEPLIFVYEPTTQGFGVAIGGAPRDAEARGTSWLVDWKGASGRHDPARTWCGMTLAETPGLALTRIDGPADDNETLAHLDAPCNAPGVGATEVARGATLGGRAWEAGRSYDVSIETTGSAIRVRVDGALEIEHPVADARGPISLYALGAATFRVFLTEREALEGEPVAFVARYDDPGALDTHSARMSFGDGTVDERVSIAAQPSNGTASARHTYADDGAFAVATCVEDDDRARTCISTSMRVHNARPVVDGGRDVLAERTARLDGASFADPGVLDTHTGTVEWGDGAITAMPANASFGRGLLDAQHDYAAPGAYVARVCVTDDEGASGCDTVAIEVVGPRAATLLARGDIVPLGEASRVDLLFLDNGSLPGHSLRIDWGDGQEEPVALDPDAGDWGVAHPTHTYARSGRYTATLTLLGPDALQTLATAEVVVENFAPVAAVETAPAVEGRPATALVTFTDPFARPGHRARIEWGDGSASEAPFETDAGASGELALTHSYAEDGDYEVRVRVCDVEDLCGDAAASTRIANAPPVALPDALSAREGARVTIDPRANDEDVAADVPLAIVSVGSAAHGRVSFTGGNVTYEPGPARYEGPDSFTYTVSDGDGGFATALVRVTVLPDLAPIARDENVTVWRYGNVSGDLLANDEDAEDGRPRFDALVQPPRAGNVTIDASGRFVYTPDPSRFDTLDRFTYRICDAFAQCDVATAFVHEDACVHRMASLEDTALGGLGSPTLHDEVEPRLVQHDRDLALVAHDARCDAVVPAEAAADEVLLALREAML